MFPSHPDDAEMTEEGFLRALQEKPDDDATRLIYADWLDEQGDQPSKTKSEYIRLDVQLAPLKEGVRGTRRRKRRRQRLAEQIDSAWLAVVTKAPIECCKFKFECPLKWENLQPVKGSDTTRFCGTCNQQVHFCATLEEAQHHAFQNHCVAVDARFT